MDNLTTEQQLVLSRMQVRSLQLQAQIRVLQDQLNANEAAFKTSVESFAKGLKIMSEGYVFDSDSLTFVARKGAPCRVEK